MDNNYYSLADLAAATGANKADMMSNPMWLIWAILFLNGGFGGFGRGAGQGLQDAEIMSQLNAIRSTMADNQNANQIAAAIAGNHEMLHGINANISNASTANLLSQKDSAAQMSSCCCEQKMLTQQMGYESQLRDQANHAATMQRIDTLANGMQTGFSQIGFLTQQQTTELNANATANTQRILDTLNNHWQSDLQQKYADAKLELSQQAQNAYLVSALKTA